MTELKPCYCPSCDTKVWVAAIQDKAGNPKKRKNKIRVFYVVSCMCLPFEGRRTFDSSEEAVIDWNITHD